MLNHQVLEELAAKDKSLRAIYQIDKDLLDKIVKFLKPINNCFNVFEKENVPTSHMVAVSYHEILHHIKETRKDDAMILIADSFSDAISQKFSPIINDIHYVAALLCPKYRKFNFIGSREERSKALKSTYVIIRDAINSMHDDPIDEPAVMPNAEHSSETSTSKKYGEDSSDDEQVEEILDELDKYLKMKVKKDDNPLIFWKSNERQFPKLSKLARMVFSKAAASSLSEKCFSVAGKIQRPDRSSIKPSNLPLCLKVTYARKFSKQIH